MLALTDLGLGGRSPPARAARDWAAFAEVVAAAGSRLVLLVPYPRAAGPRARRTVVHWDRATSVASAEASA